MLISLTDFVDFAVKSGSPKLTKVRSIKERPEYNPAHDFWKPLRERIVEFHRLREDRSCLDDFVLQLNDARKRPRYQECVKGYKKFVGRKPIQWRQPQTAVWTANELKVRINPELHLEMDGTNHLIKLYFKADKLSSNRVEMVLLLLHRTIGRKLPDSTTVALVDVPKGKVYQKARPDKLLWPLVRGEAAAFQQMWNML